MKDWFYKVVSIVMTCLLLLSTVSWTVDKHKCMGRVMDVALFSEADDCGMNKGMSLSGESQEENHCCDDESFTIEGQDDLKITFNDFSFDQQVFLAVLTQSYIALFDAEEIQVISNECYPPPILVKDIQLLDEVFLI